MVKATKPTAEGNITLHAVEGVWVERVGGRDRDRRRMKNESYEVRGGPDEERRQAPQRRVTLGAEALVSTPSTSEVKGELAKDELRNGSGVRVTVKTSGRQKKEEAQGLAYWEATLGRKD